MVIVYSKQHILRVFSSTHKIARVIDPEVDRALEPREDLPLWDWIDGMDLIRKERVQLEYFRSAYSSSIPETEFGKLWRAKESTLGALAELIAKHSRPVQVPIWKFAGRDCKRGSILRFLLNRVNAGADGPLATGHTSVGSLAARRDWSFVDAINVPFPGLLPPPMKISHRRLLPLHVRRVQVVLGSICITAALTSVSGIIIKATTAVLGGALLLAVLVIGMIICRKRLGIPKTAHYIFPGLGSFRELAISICADRGRDCG